MMRDPEHEGTVPEVDRDPPRSAATPARPDPDRSKPLRITELRIGDAAVLTVVGDMDLAGAPTFDDHVARCLATRPAALVVDLTGVTFLGTAGLAALVDANSPHGTRLPTTGGRRHPDRAAAAPAHRAGPAAGRVSHP